jgi:hypothetical protein
MAVSKFQKIDSGLMNAVAKAVEVCRNEGSPVAGQSADHWQDIAHVAIRRIRSFDRRGVSSTDRRLQIRDIAQGFVAAFESDPNLVGPLIIDYEHVAQKTLDALLKYEANKD